MGYIVNIHKGDLTMDREYKMPKAIENNLHDVYVTEKDGECAEQAVIDASSDLGYEVEDERESQKNRDDGGFMHDVKLVKRELCPWGEKVNVGWAHFNHPGPEYAKHRDEWYMYFL